MAGEKNLLKNIITLIIPYGFLLLNKKIKLHKIINNNKKINPLKISSKESPQFIVTLTSHGRRVKQTAPYAVYSLLNQTVQPDKIVLWLANETKIPKKLQKLQKSGLEIKFCEDIRSYTKLVPALHEFPNDVLITADDDVYYAPNWFELLKDAYLQDPTKIYCHRAHEICLDENKNIIPYMEWRHSIKTIEYSKRLFPTGVGGILYPPHSFNDKIFDKSRYQTLAPTADDIWFWAMARHNGKEYSLTRNNLNKYIGMEINEVELFSINSIKNDEQIKNVINEYPDVYKSIL